MDDLIKTLIAARFKSGESMEDIAASLGIAYVEIQAVVRQVMNQIDRERFAKHFMRAIRHRYSRNYYVE